MGSKLYSPSQMDQSNYLEEISFGEHPPQSGQPRPRRRTRTPSRRIRRVFTKIFSRLIAGWWWSKKRFLVHQKKLHLPSSRWTESQTERAERRIIPNSITKNWSATFVNSCQFPEKFWYRTDKIVSTEWLKLVPRQRIDDCSAIDILH